MIATARSPQRLAGLGVEIAEFADLPARVEPGALVLHSIPPEGPADVLRLLGGEPSRVVYLSSTAAYGVAELVNETTDVSPDTERAEVRLAVERAVMNGPWSSLILRCAAIYGPGRGIHERVKRGEREFSGHIVSRIHVEDLATHCEAALLSNVSGAYPVADEEPASSWEVAQYSASLLGLPAPSEATATGSTRLSGNRRVDGSAIRRALGITLQYPSYRMGIPPLMRGIRVG